MHRSGNAVVRPQRSNEEMAPMTRCAVRKLFRKAVEDVLSVLGEDAKKVIYYHLEKNQGFVLDDLPEGVDKLDRGLRMIIGNRAAELIEGRIIMELNQSLGRSLDNAGKKSFVEFAKEIVRGLEIGKLTEGR